ncbi:MAG: hypothetical protein NTV80_00535 [Verrucomicrobia bacterium]|nr:hypothetical protein [Verrucomicrobiota bacterium]
MFRCSFLFFIATVSLHAVSCACTIPVFRYALDRWEADKFHLVLPASAASDAALTDALRPLRANGKANLEITTAKDAAEGAVLYSSRESDQPVWKGTLDKAALEAILDSSGRQKILQQILAGDSAVWVIAEDGTPELLLSMLAGPKNSFDPTTTSFAAAVFGKGRVLGAWPLKDLDDASLEDACMFLVGRCGCRIKSGNPGWDLLLNVDWEKALAAATIPTETPIQKAELAKPEAVVTQLATAPPVNATNPPMNRILLIGGAILLGALALFFLRGNAKK